MSVSSIPAEARVLLHNVSWQFYEQLLKEIGEQRVYTTYDRGELELMSPLPQHEYYKEIISWWIKIISMEGSINIRPGGSTTFRREDLERGLEPDCCFWIQSAAAVRDKMDIDLRIDPPPDLVVEIDITSSSINRMAIYAAMGVPEIWRYNGNDFQVLHLQPQGTYKESERSSGFPFLAMSEFAQFLHKPVGVEEAEWVSSFQKWVRKQVKREN